MNGVVIVGGGVAAASTAAGLRDEGFAGEIVLVADEPHVPYERPPLSKEFLGGTFAPADFRVNPERWYADNDVDLLLETRVTDLDVAGHRVELSDGGTLSYDSLVLATGARAKRMPGVEGDQVHVLRTIADSEKLGERLIPGRRLIAVGAGFVGCEIAAVAAARGVEVTILHPGALPMGRALGPEIGRAMLEVHRAHGVDIRAGERVIDVVETPRGVQVRTSSGAVLECDELLIGIGSEPNVELARDGGITVDGGIVTDEFGRTDAPDVIAVGDVAVRFHPVYDRVVRVEHHDTAMKHGTNAARNLLGTAESFRDHHYFWSHQYEHNLQAYGRTAGGRSVVRASEDGRSLAVFTLADDRIVGVVTLDRPADLLQVRKLVDIPHSVTAEQLADERFPLKSLLPQRVRRTPQEARA